MVCFLTVSGIEAERPLKLPLRRSQSLKQLEYMVLTDAGSTPASSTNCGARKAGTQYASQTNSKGINERNDLLTSFVYC